MAGCTDEMDAADDGGEPLPDSGLDGSSVVDHDGAIEESDSVCADGSDCIDPCEAGSAPDCGSHGDCWSSDGVAACQCEHPYAGDTCDECEEGFSKRSGVCEPDCGECGDHARCNATLTTPSCECVAGYADTGNGCTWLGDGLTGGVLDSELDDATAWALTNMSIGAGVATFENVIVGGACKLGALEQVVRMPSREDAEALVLEIEAMTTCASTDAKACPALLVDIGDTVTRLELAGGPSPVVRELAICLGEAAYQEQVTLRVRPGLATATGALTCSATWPTLQRIRMRSAVAGECPQPSNLLGDLRGPSDGPCAAALRSTMAS